MGQSSVYFLTCFFILVWRFKLQATFSKIVANHCIFSCICFQSLPLSDSNFTTPNSLFLLSIFYTQLTEPINMLG